MAKEQSTKHWGNQTCQWKLHLQQPSTNFVSLYQMKMLVKMSFHINLRYLYLLVFQALWVNNLPALLCQHPTQSLIDGFWMKFTIVHKVSCALIDLTQWQMTNICCISWFHHGFIYQSWSWHGPKSELFWRESTFFHVFNLASTGGLISVGRLSKYLGKRGGYSVMKTLPR